MSYSISVAICTYNGERYIEAQLQSIIEQTEKPNEIILCDDNSTDNTVAIANKVLSESGINYKININKNNQGVILNFQHAIELCNGDIIFTSDQDDIWREDKIEIITKQFNIDRECIMVFTEADLVNQDRKKMSIKLWETLKFNPSMVKDDDYYEILLNRCIITGATMAFKRKLFAKVQPFSEYWIHDGWLAINAPLYGNVKAINIPLIEYRQHRNNLIGARKKSLVDRIKIYFSNVKIMDNVRRERYNRYNNFYELNRIKLDKKLSKKTKQCIRFWNEMITLKECSFLNGLEIIGKNCISGNYKKYYTGMNGVIRDILYLFVRKVV